MLSRGDLLALAVGLPATLYACYRLVRPRVGLLRNLGVAGPGDPGPAEALVGRVLAALLLLVGSFFLWLATV